MKIFFASLATLAFGLASTQAFANCYTKYDPATGEAYQVCSENPGTSINGYSHHDGAMWKYQKFYEGVYSGIDSQGNYFTIQESNLGHNSQNSQCFSADPSLCAK